MLTLLLLALSDPMTNRYAAAGHYGSKEIYLIGGSSPSTHQPVKQVDIFNPSTGRWRAGVDMSVPRDFPALTTIGASIMVAGGVNPDGTASNRVDFYHYATQKWVNGSTLPMPVSRAAACVWDLESMVIGGLGTDRGTSVNSRVVQMYNRRFSTWSYGPELPEARHGHTAVVAAGNVYVMGGETGDKEYSPSASAVVLKPKVGKWVAISPMPQARAFHAAVSFGRAIYVFGSRTPTSHPLKYDPAADKWTELPVPDLESHRTAYAEAEGRVYFFGGEGPKVANRVFDLKSEKWIR